MLNIFQKKYYNLFTEYGYSATNLDYIILSLGYNLHTKASKDAIPHMLKAIEQLFENKILYVTDWGENDAQFKQKKIDPNEALEIIKRKVEKSESLHELSGIISFQYCNWYNLKLRELNIGENTDWKWFAECVVPDIRNWSLETVYGKKVNDVNDPQ